MKLAAVKTISRAVTANANSIQGGKGHGGLRSSAPLRNESGVPGLNRGFHFRLDQVVGHSAEVHGARAAGRQSAEKVNPGGRLTARLDYAAEVSKDVKRQKTSATRVDPQNVMTHDAAFKMATNHADKINALKSASEASRTRSAGLKEALHQAHTTGGVGDQPRDDHGRWTK